MVPTEEHLLTPAGCPRTELNMPRFAECPPPAALPLLGTAEQVPEGAAWHPTPSWLSDGSCRAQWFFFSDFILCHCPGALGDSCTPVCRISLGYLRTRSDDYSHYTEERYIHFLIGSCILLYLFIYLHALFIKQSSTPEISYFLCAQAIIDFLEKAHIYSI